MGGKRVAGGKKKWRPVWWLVKWTLILAVAGYAWIALSLVMLKWVNPPTTALQAQRRVESWFGKAKYQKKQKQVRLEVISLPLQHAVIAAEDGRFYTHHGFDWEQIKDAVEDAEAGHPRGASTISQQLVKNLFLTTHGSVVRKAAEFAIVPLAERVLGKKRILELYLNVIEWGPGVFGAEAAAQFHYHEAAARVSREQGARLAAVLPAPRRRVPARMDKYSAIIQERMALMGW